jgi:hypothetical protein
VDNLPEFLGCPPQRFDATNSDKVHRRSDQKPDRSSYEGEEKASSG